jgi:hypothetical protein
MLQEPMSLRVHETICAAHSHGSALEVDTVFQNGFEWWTKCFRRRAHFLRLALLFNCIVLPIFGPTFWQVQPSSHRRCHTCSRLVFR